MNLSIHRIGLVVAAAAVVITVGGALVADGYVSARKSVTTPVVPAVSSTATPATAAPLEPQLVYVRPAPPPQVIHVTEKAPVAAPKVVHVVVASRSGGGDESDGSEAGD